MKDKDIISAFMCTDAATSTLERKGMVEDTMAEGQESNGVQSSSMEKEDDDGGNVVAAHTPSPSAVSALLSEAGGMDYKCNISIAASSLRRAKREIESERSVHRRGKACQFLLTEMLRIRK